MNYELLTTENAPVKMWTKGVPVEADARRYLEWGATFVAVGSDLGVFRSATQKLADAFKK